MAHRPGVNPEPTFGRLNRARDPGELASTIDPCAIESQLRIVLV
jgi:hypothetical protein